jgi:hypothetical protein
MNVDGLKVVLSSPVGEPSLPLPYEPCKLASAGTMYSCREFAIEQGTRVQIGENV